MPVDWSNSMYTEEENLLIALAIVPDCFSEMFDGDGVIDEGEEEEVVVEVKRQPRKPRR